MSKPLYMAVLFSLDGDFVTDFRASESPEEVWDRVNDMGSKWIFYPLVFVVRQREDGYFSWKSLARRRIHSAGDYVQHFEGRTLGTVKRMLENDEDGVAHLAALLTL